MPSSSSLCGQIASAVAILACLALALQFASRYTFASDALQLPSVEYEYDFSEAPPHSAGPGGLDALRAATRASTEACNATFYDGITIEPPLRHCTVEELTAAVSAARRNGTGEWALHRGAPLVVPGCRLEWFSGERVCDLLQNLGGLDVHGDSLARHLHMTLRSLALGDLADGTTRHMGPHAWMCTCDYSYDDGHLRRFERRGNFDSPGNKFCRVNTLAYLNFSAVRAVWPGYCPRWGAIDYLPVFSWVPPATSRAAVLLVEGGLKCTGRLSTECADSIFIRKPGATRLIFTTLWAPGEKKPPQYEAAFGRPATLAFNDLVRARAALANATVLDAYAVTFNTPSIDGQHYWKATNVDVAQVLLNILAAMRREAQNEQQQRTS